MLASLNRFMKGLTDYLLQWVRFFGRILITIGSILARQHKNSFLVASRVIETCMRSFLIRIKVVDVIDRDPLHVTFVTHMQSSYSNRIDWSFFRLELMLQLGCGFHDIATYYIGTSGSASIYYVDITRTALSNLELGRAESEPDLFKERDTEYRLKRTLELARETTLTPELLEKELGISSYHANLLYTQATKSEALPKRPRGKLVN